MTDVTNDYFIKYINLSSLSISNHNSHTIGIIKGVNINFDLSSLCARVARILAKSKQSKISNESSIFRFLHLGAQY